MDRIELTAYLKETSENIIKECECRLPIDIKMVCEKLGIEYYEDQISGKFDGICFDAEDGTPQICVNNSPSKALGRRRFSGAHELGHWLLSKVINEGSGFNLSKTRSNRSMIENLCDEFAADLLMPEEAMKIYYRYYSNPELNFLRLANRFGVTTAAIKVRLKNLGLIDPTVWY